MKTIQDINIDNKNVIIRFDYNVPIENGIILDDTRIIKSLKTLNYVLEKANKVIILSHLGRIKNKEDLDKNTFIFTIFVRQGVNFFGKKVDFIHFLGNAR